MKSGSRGCDVFLIVIEANSSYACRWATVFVGEPCPLGARSPEASRTRPRPPGPATAVQDSACGCAVPVLSRMSLAYLAPVTQQRVCVLYLPRLLSPNDPLP